MTVAGYTRISTPDQNPELQLRELREHAHRQGWELAEAYQDVASGAKSKRPGPAHRPRKIFDREKVVRLHQHGLSLRRIAKSMGIGLGTVSRTLKERSER